MEYARTELADRLSVGQVFHEADQLLKCSWN